jgi:putative IMPACT (imprinted ancient) family translation regulator
MRQLPDYEPKSPQRRMAQVEYLLVEFNKNTALRLALMWSEYQRLKNANYEESIHQLIQKRFKEMNLRCFVKFNLSMRRRYTRQVL